MPRDWVYLPVRIEEADDPFGLLEWLNEPIEQDAVETAIMPMDTGFVVLIEGIQARLPLPITARIVPARLGSQPRPLPLEYPPRGLCPLVTLRPKGYQGRSPWLVRVAKRIGAWIGALAVHSQNRTVGDRSQPSAPVTSGQCHGTKGDVASATSAQGSEA